MTVLDIDGPVFIQKIFDRDLLSGILGIEFSFILLADVDSTTTIRFSATRSIPAGKSEGGGDDPKGMILWAAGADLPAGTIIHISINYANDIISQSQSATVGSVIAQSPFTLPVFDHANGAFDNPEAGPVQDVSDLARASGVGNLPAVAADGNNFFDGTTQTGHFNGGPLGNDTVSYFNSLTGVKADMTTPSENTGDAAGDTYADIEHFDGSNHNDTLIGASGNDILHGRNGADRLIGMSGDDYYYVDNENDVIVEDIWQGDHDQVAVHTGRNYTLTAGADIELLTTTDFNGTSTMNLTGNQLAQKIIGNHGNNIIGDGGGGGVDTLIGSDGNDTYIVYNPNTQIQERFSEGEFDRVSAGVEFFLPDGQHIELLTTNSRYATYSINLEGNSYKQTIVGNEGHNSLSDGGGSASDGDTLIGGGGNDKYLVRSAGTVVIEAVGEGTFDQVSTYKDFTLSAGSEVEHISAGGSYSSSHIDLVGNEFAQTIVGNNGRNILGDGGGSGADTLIGGLNDDTYIVYNSGTQIEECASQGTNDRVRVGVDYALQDDVHVELLTTNSRYATYSINLEGNNTRWQTIVGNDGQNIIGDGGGSSNTLIGGAGNDTYYVSHWSTDVMEEQGGGGFDRVFTNTQYTLTRGSNIEAIATTSRFGTSSINLTGNKSSQTITGNDGANILGDGGGVSSGSGDTLVGGGGNDIYNVDNTETVVIEAVGGGDFDRVTTNRGFTLSAGSEVESIAARWPTAPWVMNLTGNEFAQAIVGNNGRNIISDGGGTGADTLRGNSGDDVYIVYNSGTQIVERSSGGASDRVSAGVDYVLQDSVFVEMLVANSRMASYSLNLEGNTYKQTIIGNEGRNIIGDGGGSATNGDTLVGGGGNDLYYVRSVGTVVIEVVGEGDFDRVSTAVNFTLTAGSEIETINTTFRAGTSSINLTGNELNQWLQGNAGANRLDGKGGSDTLSGEVGPDTFVFSSTLGAGDIDAILDFNEAEDQIELKATIFNTLSVGGLSANAFASNSSGTASDAEDRIIYDTNSGALYYDADGIGATAALQFAQLSAGLGLTFGHFDVA